MPDKEVFAAPHLQSGYSGDDEPHPAVEEAPDPGGAQRGADNRGRRAAVRPNGEVVGSGASAGGKGGPEDFDSDPQAGGGTFVVKHEDDKPDKGGDASQHNST